jgi:hypothetical protein
MGVAVIVSWEHEVQDQTKRGKENTLTDRQSDKKSEKNKWNENETSICFSHSPLAFFFISSLIGNSFLTTRVKKRETEKREKWRRYEKTWNHKTRRQHNLRNRKRERETRHQLPLKTQKRIQMKKNDSSFSVDPLLIVNVLSWLETLSSWIPTSLSLSYCLSISFPVSYAHFLFLVILRKNTVIRHKAWFPLLHLPFLSCLASRGLGTRFSWTERWCVRLCHTIFRVYGTTTRSPFLSSSSLEREIHVVLGCFNATQGSSWIKAWKKNQVLEEEVLYPVWLRQQSHEHQSIPLSLIFWWTNLKTQWEKKNMRGSPTKKTTLAI